MNFWENVEKIREYKEISRKELALRADFSLNSISTGIARNSIPLADVACRIADVLGVSVEFLVTGKTAQKGRLSEEKKIEEQAETKKEQFLKYMDDYSAMVEEFSLLSKPLQKALKEVIHEASVNAQGNM
ncbi:helix-turn-helix domain-containing protein [Treponema sp.]|uniref:helix-turn-helix domain-containing protein n=1 Tax=Treponema sp. TaxID=166 RepID=UPI003EFC482F